MRSKMRRLFRNPPVGRGVFRILLLKVRVCEHAGQVYQYFFRDASRVRA